MVCILSDSSSISHPKECCRNCSLTPWFSAWPLCTKKQFQNLQTWAPGPRRAPGRGSRKEVKICFQRYHLRKKKLHNNLREESVTQGSFRHMHTFALIQVSCIQVTEGARSSRCWRLTSFQAQSFLLKKRLVDACIAYHLRAKIHTNSCQSCCGHRWNRHFGAHVTWRSDDELLRGSLSRCSTVAKPALGRKFTSFRVLAVSKTKGPSWSWWNFARPHQKPRNVWVAGPLGFCCHLDLLQGPCQSLKKGWQRSTLKHDSIASFFVTCNQSNASRKMPAGQKSATLHAWDPTTDFQHTMQLNKASPFTFWGPVNSPVHLFRPWPNVTTSLSIFFWLKTSKAMASGSHSETLEVCCSFIGLFFLAQRIHMKCRRALGSVYRWGQKAAASGKYCSSCKLKLNLVWVKKSRKLFEPPPEPCGLASPCAPHPRTEKWWPHD